MSTKINATHGLTSSCKRSSDYRYFRDFTVWSLLSFLMIFFSCGGLSSFCGNWYFLFNFKMLLICSTVIHQSNDILKLKDFELFLPQILNCNKWHTKKKKKNQLFFFSFWWLSFSDAFCLWFSAHRKDSYIFIKQMWIEITIYLLWSTASKELNKKLTVTGFTIKSWLWVKLVSVLCSEVWSLDSVFYCCALVMSSRLLGRETLSVFVMQE